MSPREGDPSSDAAARRVLLSSGRLLARNAALTIAGRSAIVVLAIVAVPLLVSGLGVARFGILSLAWALIAYTGHLDLGLGRALTKLTSERLGDGREDEIPPLFWTALSFLFAVGIATGASVALATPWFVERVLNIPEPLLGETRATFTLLAASVPFVLVSAGLRGTLEAHQRFDLTNAIAVPIAILTYFGPLLVLQFTSALPMVVSAVVLSRVVACVVSLALSLKVNPDLRRISPSRRFLGPLVRFGGWLTAGSVLAPLLGTMDRFVIGTVLTTAAVAYYAAPFDAVKQLLVVSAAFSSVLFPAYSINLKADARRAERLLGGGTRATFVGLFPLVLAVITFAPEGLELWLGSDFARNSTTPLQWLAAGIMVNALAQVAFGLAQSSRPDLVFGRLAIELPLYVGALWFLLGAYGIVGVAVAWTARVVLDFGLIYALLYRLSLVRGALALRMAAYSGAGLTVFALAAQLQGAAVKTVFLAVTLVAFGVLTWTHILEVDERERVGQRLKALRATP